jgi:hypothetical protein
MEHIDIVRTDNYDVTVSVNSDGGIVRTFQVDGIAITVECSEEDWVKEEFFIRSGLMDIDFADMGEPT